MFTNRRASTGIIRVHIYSFPSTSMDQSLNLRGKRCPKSDLSVKATFRQRVKVWWNWIKFYLHIMGIIQNVLIFQTHYPYEGNNLKRFHVLIFLGRITILPSEETFAPMFERLRAFHQEFMAKFKDTNWQDGFTGFSFQWWQYLIQTIWYVSILIYQGKVFWCKIYVWRSKTLVYKFLFLEKG